MEKKQDSCLCGVGQGAGEALQLDNSVGHVDPAAGADDGSVGKAEQICRLEIQGPELRLALEGPIPIAGSRRARDGVVREEHVPGTISQASRDVDAGAGDFEPLATDR